jgi:hypothetical protein
MRVTVGLPSMAFLMFRSIEFDGQEFELLYSGCSYMAQVL